MMRPFSTLLLLTALFAPSILAAQNAPRSIELVPAPATNTPTALLKPALDSLQETLPLLHPEKWKVANETSQQAQTNVISIRLDLNNTLPGLLATADQAPDSVLQVMPAYRNIEALYDVLLRVTQVATLSAPTAQIVALQESMEKLEASRTRLGESIMLAARAQNHQLQEAQNQVRTLQSAPPPAPVAAACPEPAPSARKRKPRPKAVAHKAAAPAAAPQNTAPATH